MMMNAPIQTLPKEYEEEIVGYLDRHPEFFMRHEDLLSKMRIPHRRGTTISLVEKQLTVLREENRHLQRKLEGLFDIARRNEALNLRIQRVISALAGVTRIDGFFDQLYQVLGKEFRTDTIALKLFEVKNSALSEREEVAEYDAEVFQLFENVLKENKPVCGRLSVEQHAYLFPHQATASAVLIPLGVPKPNGILALGSKDMGRFYPGMSTELLKFMGELISLFIQSCLNKQE